MPDEQVMALVMGLVFFAIFAIVGLTIVVKFIKSTKEKQRMEEYKQRSAEQPSEEEKRRKQEEMKQRLLQKYGLLNNDAKSSSQNDNMRQIARTFDLYVDDDDDEEDDEQARKHAKHVEDSHEHGHVGEEEHYEEIIGSLGEVNDEGCADLTGVRFVAHDLAYEISSQETPNYDRLAQAMVLGEIVNSPRFKTPYSRKK